MSPSLKRVVKFAILAIVLLLVVAAAVTYWMVGPAVRCLIPDQGAVEPGWSARTLVSGGLERCYYVYAPPGHDLTQALPVVFSFHGFLSNPVSQAVISRWHQLADQEGFLVAYPQGRKFPQRWNSGTNWGDAGVDDVGFFRDMLDDLSSAAAVDRSRVYVSGFSNGGGMTMRIGCEVADLVAALGSVAGAVASLEDCSPVRPVPVMAFHGTADPLVPYQGGAMSGRLLRRGAGATHAPSHFVAVEDWVATWARGNGCHPTPEIIPPQGDAGGIHYLDCDEGAGVTLYTIDGGGHAWPGGWAIPFVGKTSTDIDATEELWRHFQEHRLESRP